MGVGGGGGGFQCRAFQMLATKVQLYTPGPLLHRENLLQLGEAAHIIIHFIYTAPLIAVDNQNMLNRALKQ